MELHYLFGEQIVFYALDLIDRQYICKLVGSPSTRTCYQVKSGANQEKNYICFDNELCSCDAYHYTVQSKREALLVFFFVEIGKAQNFFIVFQKKK